MSVCYGKAVLIDENRSSRQLVVRLQAAGHDVVLATDVGLVSVPDARVLARAVAQGRPLLTRDGTTKTSPPCTT